jgi:parvulin-like peptidyl-prolyl isomerase
MRKIAIGVIVVWFGLPLAGRNISEQEPDRVVVQHILISFKGADPGIKAVRSREEAESLARRLFFEARQGADFDGLVKQYTDDSYPGIYRMSNVGIQPDGSRGERLRTRMVKSFGDISFRLKVGEIGMALYHPQNSRFGWHIIKRLE